QGAAGAELVGPAQELGQGLGDAAADPKGAVLGRRHVLDARRQAIRRPEVRDGPSTHEERHVAAGSLLLREDAHRRDAGPAGDEEQVARGAVDDEGRAERPEEDRKSTRLNSSHGSISYAV